MVGEGESSTAILGVVIGLTNGLMGGVSWAGTHPSILAVGANAAKFSLMRAHSTSASLGSPTSQNGTSLFFAPTYYAFEDATITPSPPNPPRSASPLGSLLRAAR